MRSFLIECEVDENYTSHSLRHASISTSLSKEVDISIIKSLAGWSNKSKVFEKFYNRPIINNKTAFASSILS